MPDQIDRRTATSPLPAAAQMSPEEQDRTRSRMVGLLRGLFLILLVIFTALVIVQDSATHNGFELVRWWPLAVGGMFLFFIGFVALDVLTPKRKLSTITAVFIGLIAGVLVTVILGTVLDLFSEIYGLTEPRLMAPFKVMLGLGICYLTVSTVMQTQDDFRLVIPYVEFAKKIRGPRPLLLDSSALIDGRLLGIAELGFFQAPLVAPRCVIDEMHRLSDSADRLKRARGRRGLEILERLQRVGRVDVSIDETEVQGASVDQKIVELARAISAQVLTTDLGLARVAAIHGVAALNLNELSNALKQTAAQGDSLTVRLVRKGEQPGQAVGYLEDGTMVVGDNAADLIGTDVTLIVTSALQTSAGRMIFGAPEGRESGRYKDRGHGEPGDDEGHDSDSDEGDDEPSSDVTNAPAGVRIELGQPPRCASTPPTPAPPSSSTPPPSPSVRPESSGRLTGRNPRRG